VTSAHATLPIGTRFGKLVTVGVRKYWMRGNLKKPDWEVLVKCDCGTEKTALVWQLKGRRTISCGCARRDKHTKITFTKGYRNGGGE
jgi:hypothetical protein